MEVAKGVRGDKEEGQGTSSEAPSPITTLSVKEANALIHRLSTRNRVLEDELRRVAGQRDLLKVVLDIVSDDLNLKHEQLELLYSHLSLNGVWKECESRKVQRNTTKILNASVSSPQGDIRIVSVPSASSALQHGETKEEHGNTTNAQPSSHPTFSVAFRLPRDVFIYMVAFLPFSDLCRVACVCKRWSQAACAEHLWKHVYEQRWQPRRARMNGQAFVRPSCVLRTQSHHLPAPPRHCPSGKWKKRFYHRLDTQRRWTAGTPRVMTLSGHSGTVTCLRFDHNLLVSGADDGTMVLWDLDGGCRRSKPFPLMQQHHKSTKTTRRLSSFVGHGGPVWCLDFQGDLLASGSYDRTIKLWGIRSGVNVQTLRGHNCWVSAVQIANDRILSGSYDASLKVWSFDPQHPSAAAHCVSTLEGERGNAIYCLQFAPEWGRAVTGCRHRAIQVWDIPTGKLQSVLLGHRKQVYAVQWDGNKFVSGSGDNSVKVWDQHTGRCEMTLEGHTNPVLCLQSSFDEEYKVVSAGYDKSLRMWDLRTGGCIRTFYGHSSAVFCLQYDNNRIVSGAADSNILLWNFARPDDVTLSDENSQGRH